MNAAASASAGLSVWLSAVPARSAAIAVVVYAFMWLEARRAARNEAAQRARGGVEPRGDVYAAMRVAYPAVFLAMVAEGAMRGGDANSWWFLAGALLFAAAKALKWWAIATLGRYWTFRVIVVPGTSPIDTGPYRFFRHPNYVAVAGEIAGVAMTTGARVAGPLALVVFGSLMLRRVAVENRALDAILRRG
jgi:methyltransferase